MAPRTESQASSIAREVERSIRRARNGIGHVTGLRRTRVGLTAKETVWARAKVQLWRYHNPSIRKSPPVLLVMSLVTQSFILDLRPGSSYVERLRDAGYDTYMLDWGVPDALDSHNTLTTYIDEYLPLAVDALLKEAGSSSVTVVGYCLGGVLSLVFTAAYPAAGVQNLVLMATPIDCDQVGLIAGLVREGRIEVDRIIDDTGNVPADAIRAAFRLRRPTSDLVSAVHLWEILWNDEYVDAYQAMSQWLNDHIPFPGAAARELVDVLIRKNQLMRGWLTLGGRRVRLASVTCPLLNVIAVRDDIVPLGASTPALKLVGSSDKEELRVDAGHVALVAGPRRGSRHDSTHDPLAGCSLGPVSHAFRLSMTRPEIEMRRPAPADADSLTRFFNDVPEEDRNFIKEDVLDPGVVRSWTKDRVAHRLLAWDADKVIAYCAVIPGTGWSSHVGEVRIVVAPRHRRRGVGRQMARVALLEAMRMGVEKLFIELIADQEAAIAMFVDLGFVGEALLKNHVRDRQGRLRDLIVLSHDIRDNLAAMQTAGMGQT